MSDRLRHFSWLPEGSDNQSAMRAQRAASAMRIDIHQEWILDGFRRRLHAESQAPHQAGRQQSDGFVQRGADTLEQLTSW